VLVDAVGPRDITLLATGSEVQIAIEAAKLLAAEHQVQAAVVSMPCWELFESQPISYQLDVLGSAPRVAIEAAARFGWDRWLGDQGMSVGMTGFGASAPAPDLYDHIGITPNVVSQVARSLLPVGKNRSSEP
jgi:transketolase